MKYDEEEEGKRRENDGRMHWRLVSNLIYCENPDPKQEPLTQNVRAEGGRTEKFAKTVNLPLTRKKTPYPNITGEKQNPYPGGAKT